MFIAAVEENLKNDKQFQRVVSTFDKEAAEHLSNSK